MTSKSSGFTLIELLVVVAVIGILAAIGLTSYNGYVSTTERKSAENLMQQISLGQTEYYSNDGNYYSATSTSCTASSTTSTNIEIKLLGSADVINDDTAYDMCIMADTTSNYLIKAEEKDGTCEITMTSDGTFTRTGC